MSVPPNPRDVVRAMVAVDFRPVENTFSIVREKQTGDGAVVAVAFEDEAGIQRRGLYGLRRRADGVWRPNGRSMGSERSPAERDVWMTWGGWSGDSPERSVLGGWVAVASAVTARATDHVAGRTLDDRVEDGVALFVYEGAFGPYSQMELLDAEGLVLRTGPLHRRP